MTDVAARWIEQVKALVTDPPMNLSKLEIMEALDAMDDFVATRLDAAKDELFAADEQGASNRP